MTKILVIPDLHGRGFWKEPCNNWEGKIIFLGDYHDPYGEYIVEEPDKVESLTNLKELVAFVENRRKISDVICLLGNHELPYFNGNGKCRFDYWEQKEVKELIKEASPYDYSNGDIDAEDITELVTKDEFLEKFKKWYLND